MEQAARQRRSRGCARNEGHQVGVGEEPEGPDPGAAGARWRRCPRPTRACTGRTCSRSNSGWCSRPRGETGRELLAGWLAWARRSQLPGFVTLAATIKRFQQLIFNTLDHGLSNALSEATNTHLRALTKRANGFHTPEAFIAMAMLTRGGLCPALPNRP